MLVTLLVFNQGKIVVHELEPARGDQTACEGLVDKTNYLKQIRIALNIYTLTRFNMNKTIHFLYNNF